MKRIAATICLLVLSFADLALAQQPAPVGPGATGPAPLVEKPLRFGGRLGFNFARVSADPDLGDQLESRVGKRANVDVALEVDPRRVRADGVGIFRAPNGVILARRIPRRAIVDVVPMTRRAEARITELRARLSLG